jgi:hypothetical protein
MKTSTMLIKARSAIIAIVAVLAIAPPELAQSSAQQYPGAMHRYPRQTVGGYNNGVDAFDVVPGGGAFSPALTGGGSVGYNESLRHDQW